MKLVNIVSIWTKIEGLEGKLMGRDKNVTYPVAVEEGETIQQTLENAFMKTNMDNRPLPNSVCSTTAGDMMILDGVHYLVEGHGFTKLSPAQAKAIQKLSSRDTSFGLNFMIKHCSVPAN